MTAGTPITPENAPPGTKVRCVDDVGASGEIHRGDAYTVQRWGGRYMLNIAGFSCARLAERFVLADPPAVAPATGYKTEGKPDFTLLVYEMLEPVIRVLEFGERKHGRYNYLTNPKVTDRELVAAGLRHGLKAAINHKALDDGPDGSGQPHAAASAANWIMLLHRWAAAATKETK